MKFYTLKRFWIPALLGFMLLCSAIIHRMLIADTALYKATAAVEFSLLIPAMFYSFFLLVAVLANLIMRRWENAGILFLAWLALFGQMFIAIIIDMPTLLYAT